MNIKISNEEENNKKLEVLADNIRPVRAPRGKKGKKFANKDYMLSVLDKVNGVLEERSSAFFAKEGEIIKAIAQRDRMRDIRKQAKIEKLNSTKARLLDAKKKVVGGKGDHRKFDDQDVSLSDEKSFRVSNKSFGKSEFSKDRGSKYAGSRTQSKDMPKKFSKAGPKGDLSKPRKRVSFK
jgi:hypothetical protein